MKIRILCFLCSLFALSAFAQKSANLIKVEGNAQVYAIPELLVVSMSLTAKELNYTTCSDKLVLHYNQLEAAFEKNDGVATKLKSSGLSIRENTSWVQGKSKKDGYIGSMSINLEVPFSNTTLNTVMNTLKKLDFSVPYSLSFKLSEAQKEKLLQETIEKAVNDANTKATHIGTALGVKLGKVKEVNFGYTSSNDNLLQPEYSRMDAVNMKSGKSLNLNPKKIEIKKSVGVVWKIQQ